MDNLSKKQRSHCMSRIRSNNTKIEIAFRKFVWSRGLRGYRLKTKFKGRPDLYFPATKIVVFIDGCFWHKCPKCFVRPKSRNEYWDGKIRYNVIRDKKTTRRLRKETFTVIRFWEHEIEDNIERCYKKLKKAYEKNLQDS
jgi:DNA mismatch endonuclease, patch repair protein